MQYRGAIFDLDGTLLNTLDDLADCMNAVLCSFGMPRHPADPYRYFVGDGMENLARRAAPAGVDDLTIRKMAAAMGEKYGAGWAAKTVPYDGIPALLDVLAERGLMLGVLSNKPDSFTQAMVRHYFGEGRFQAIFGAREGVAKKPDPAGALEIAGCFRLPPAEILYLGDTNTDMRTGRAAGMYTVGVTWGFRPAAELTDSGANVLVGRPDEVPGLL